MTENEIDTKRRGYEGVDWIHVTQDREKSKHDNDPSDSIIYNEFLD